MITTTAIVAVMLSQAVMPSATSRRGAGAIADAIEARPLVADKHGFMQWQWVQLKPPGSRGATGSIETARAKFIGVKDNIITLKTDRGVTLKIHRDKIGRKQEEWLASELARRDEKEHATSKARP